MPKGPRRKNNSGVEGPNPNIKKTDIFGGLTLWYGSLAVFFAHAQIPFMPLWIMLAIIPLATSIKWLILLPGEAIGLDIVKKSVKTFLVFNVFWSMGLGCCWLCLAKQSLPIKVEKPPTHYVVQVEHVHVTPDVPPAVHPSKANDALPQTDFATSPAIQPHVVPPTPEQVLATPQSLTQSDVEHPYVVMLLPANVIGDIEVSADGKSITPERLDDLRLRVFVSPNATTRFIERCSQFGSRTNEYFPRFNQGEIEPFAS